MKKNVKFEVTSSLGKKVSTTVEYWRKIVETKHPSMEGQEELVKHALTGPDEVRRSSKDASVHLYYRKQNGKYCCAVAKHLNGEGFLVTTYITDKIKVGELV